jgi:hypothetical protein
MWHEGLLLEEGSFRLHPQPEADEIVSKRRKIDDNFEQGNFIEPINSPTSQI